MRRAEMSARRTRRRQTLYRRVARQRPRVTRHCCLFNPNQQRITCKRGGQTMLFGTRACINTSLSPFVHHPYLSRLPPPYRALARLFVTLNNHLQWPPNPLPPLARLLPPPPPRLPLRPPPSPRQRRRLPSLLLQGLTARRRRGERAARRLTLLTSTRVSLVSQTSRLD